LKVSELNNLSFNDAANYYYHELGANPIPMDSQSKIPLVKWSSYQNQRVPAEVFEDWKTNGLFNKGIGLIAGKLYRVYGGETYYLIAVDLDNLSAIEAIRTVQGKKITLEEFTKEGIIAEQHSGDSNRAHLLFLSHRSYKQLSSTATDDPNAPAIEVKGSARDGLICVTPSLHKDGTKRQVVAYPNQDLQFNFSDHLDKRIDGILNEYGISYLSGSSNGNCNEISIYELFEEDTVIYEGHNRHKALLRVIESLLKRNYSILDKDEIKQLSQRWNQKHCKPPLNDTEFEKQWKDASRFISSKQVEVNTSVDSNKNTQEKYPELKDNIYYQINEKPEKYVIAYKQKNQLIEATAKSVTKQVGGNETIEKYLIHNNTFLACIPTKIIRHKNPLAFLQLQTTFTMDFVDSIGEYYTFSHKTLAGIIQSLKELGLVLGDGADSALAAIKEAYKERNLIEINEDLGYIGFFKIHDKIIASNLEIKEPSIDKLSDALALIEELKTCYENRRDLLATSIVWGMVAPAIFMLKTNNYFLKALNFYGFSNATKSNTGKIILALDGNHEDYRKHALNFNMVDTQPRLGDTVSRSTFPILIDEVDLSDIRNTQLVNMIKVVIESVIARGKFMSSKALDTVTIPALSCLILTSNSPPPLHNSGFMRRVISRNFPMNESWKQDDPKALAFKEYLRINLPRLKALGDFRNWYIMNHQAEILDAERPEPLDLGLKILKESFGFCGKIIPQWLVDQRLPENQLEESIEDNDVIVQGAFEKLINERVSKALYIWNLGKDKIQQVELPDTITKRLIALAKNNLLEYVKYVAKSGVKKEGIRFSTGILSELYSHGVGKDQLPHLTTLANYMKAEYRKSDGKNIIFAEVETLEKYFDPKDDENSDLRSYS
jgi:Bifunctional DNA primase/polymerase, N-terminal